jgi:hypothetical protein
MLSSLVPYPEQKLMLRMTWKPDWRYTICLAIQDVYKDIPDPEVRRKLRYVATIAKAQADRLYEIDSKWLMEMYPSVEEYNKLMGGEKENG